MRLAATPTNHSVIIEIFLLSSSCYILLGAVRARSAHAEAEAMTNGYCQNALQAVTNIDAECAQFYAVDKPSPEPNWYPPYMFSVHVIATVSTDR